MARQMLQNSVENVVWKRYCVTPVNWACGIYFEFLLIDCTSHGIINAQIEYKYHAVFVLQKTGTRLHRFSRNEQATNWINLRKNIFVKTNFISTFFRERNLEVKNLNWCVIWTIERRFFPVVKSATDGLVKFALFSCYWPMTPIS